MKALHLTAVLFCLFVGKSIAQNVEIPQKEFSILIGSAPVEMKVNESKKVEVRLLKSKSYQKSKAQMSISSTLPQGISITFNPDKGNFDATEAVITTSADTKPGQYSLVISATLNYKTKASILQLDVQ